MVHCCFCSPKDRSDAWWPLLQPESGCAVEVSRCNRGHERDESCGRLPARRKTLQQVFFGGNLLLPHSKLVIEFDLYRLKPKSCSQRSGGLTSAVPHADGWTWLRWNHQLRCGSIWMLFQFWLSAVVLLLQATGLGVGRENSTNICVRTYTDSGRRRK